MRLSYTCTVQYRHTRAFALAVAEPTVVPSLPLTPPKLADKVVCAMIAHDSLENCLLKAFTTASRVPPIFRHYLYQPMQHRRSLEGSES